MKNNLIHELIGRIYETRFSKDYKEELMKCSYLKKMDEELLEEIVKLDDYDFNYYLSFLYKIYKKNNNLMMYYDKLIKITKLLLPKLGSENANALVDILINTNLLDSQNLIDFTNLLLNTKEIEIVDKIVDLVYNDEIKDRSFNIIMKTLIHFTNSLASDFILGLINNKRIVNNEVELKLALDFLNKTKEESKLVAFYKLFILGDLKDITLYSGYGMLIAESILNANSPEQLNTIVKLGLELKNSRFRNSILKQILKSKNKYALEEYQELIKIPNILNDNYIIEVMDKLDKIKTNIQGIIIKELLVINPRNKLLLIDEVLKKEDVSILYPVNYLDKIKGNILENLLNDRDLFGIVLNIKETYKYDFLMKVLEHQDLLLNKNSREVIKDFFKVKEEYKYVAFYEYINNNISSKEFRLDDDYSRNIIMLLKGTKKNFQAKTLVRVSKLVKGNKNADNLLIKAAFVQDEMRGILLGDLLETELVDDVRFDDILSNFDTCKTPIALVGMIELARNKRLKDSKFLLGYFMIMKRLKKVNQVGVLLNILDKYPDLDEYELFKYCEKIMFITSTKLLFMIESLILNNKKLDKETIELCLLELNNNSNHENIKFIKNYLRLNGQEDILGESPLEHAKVMYKLDNNKGSSN